MMHDKLIEHIEVNTNVQIRKVPKSATNQEKQ